MSSSLGNNLSELDRLLLELNAVQHNPSGFPAGVSGSLDYSWAFGFLEDSGMSNHFVSLSPR